MLEWRGRCRAVVLALALAAPAGAHDTWLLPGAFAVRAGGSVELAMTSGMGFPKNESPVAPDRIARSGFRAGGGSGELKIEGTRDGALRLSAVLSQAGVATLWAVSRPRTLDLKPDQVAHYLEEIGQADTVGKAWEARGRPAFKETYSKATKTFVRVGTTSGKPLWQDPVGLPLELVPVSDPTAIKAGDTFVLRLLWEGKPLDTVKVAALGPDGKPQMLRPDAAGRVSFAISRPGPWLFKATRLTESAKRPNEWESEFTTLTVEAGK
jgi:uncharacterized GH25 family protein